MSLTIVRSYSSPVLYKKSSTGALRQWHSWAIGNEVFTEFGQVEGKLQLSRDVVKGKNFGKANATTGEQQAALEAEYLYKKQVKRGYISDFKQAQVTTNALPGVLPMLAHVYEDVKSPIYPAFVQPKLDGVRCLAVVRDGKCVLYTRSQKVIDTVPHVNAAVEFMVKKNHIRNVVLDGELYNHALKDDFGRILGAIKRKESSEDSKFVYFYVYDLTSENLEPTTFSQRTKILESLLKGVGVPLMVVQTVLVKSETGMREATDAYVKMGYEGAMYRSTSGFYEGKRSKHLLKIKTMRDEEFEVIGTQEGRGKLMGLVGAWVCRMKSGVEFKAKSEGKLSDLIKFNSKEAQEKIGSKLTVRFQGLTPDGAPRFPVGVRFRDSSVD